MKTSYAQLLIISLVIVVTLLINFRFTTPEQVKQEKEIIIKTIYVPCTTQPKDSLENSFLKKEVFPPYQNYSKYYQSKHIHKKSYIS
jgi:hypothetical protein